MFTLPLPAGYTYVCFDAGVNPFVRAGLSAGSNNTPDLLRRSDVRRTHRAGGQLGYLPRTGDTRPVVSRVYRRSKTQCRELRYLKRARGSRVPQAGWHGEEDLVRVWAETKGADGNVQRVSLLPSCAPEVTKANVDGATPSP